MMAMTAEASRTTLLTRSLGATLRDQLAYEVHISGNYFAEILLSFPYCIIERLNPDAVVVFFDDQHVPFLDLLP
jgi:hypothetical protein